MVPVQMGALKHDVGNDTEDGQRDALLNHLQLDEVERAAVLNEPQPVGGYLTAVFEEGNHPRKGDDTYQRPVVRDAILLKFQMPIPSERHEDGA